MNTPPFMKVSQGEIKGWVREDITHLLPPAFLEDPVTFVRGTGGKVIKESQLRWAAILTLSSGRKIFIKRDKTKGWPEIFKYFILPSKARKEWFIAHQLRKRNLNIPKPLGWVERVHRGLVKESYYLSEAIESGVSLAETADLLKDEKISSELVKAVIKVHSSGLLHQDLHAGNFLWDGESFFLIDLHRARLLRSLSLNQRLWNLSHLFHSLRPIWDEKEHLRFLDQYFEGDSISSQKKKEYLTKIHSWMDRLQK
ncbi:MAG: lipopolysaccharide kinase InaA family protein, partial [Deltaproteobacteria bacterium]|nr:lipopolysaccharide kinase InaA family protein [Deltaproteobacteria bacterium]